jgi:hypothetical protein
MDDGSPERVDSFRTLVGGLNVRSRIGAPFRLPNAY